MTYHSEYNHCFFYCLAPAWDCVSASNVSHLYRSWGGLYFLTYTPPSSWKYIPGYVTDEHTEWCLLYTMCKASTGSNSNSSENSHTIIVIPPTVTHQYLNISVWQQANELTENRLINKRLCNEWKRKACFVTSVCSNLRTRDGKWVH